MAKKRGVAFLRVGWYLQCALWIPKVKLVAGYLYSLNFVYLFPWDTWVLEVFQGWTRFIPSRKGCHIKSFFTCFFTRMNFTIPLRQGVSYHIYSLPLKWSCFSYFSRKNNFVPVFVTRSNGLWKESLVAGISLYHSLSR